MPAEAPTPWLRRLWERMTSAYGHSWTSVHGTSPQDPATGDLTVDGDTWSRALAGLTAQQVGAGLDGCLREAEDFPPSVGRFRAMCLGIPSLVAVKRELAAKDTQRSSFACLVWGELDAWAYRHADARAAERMLRDAYEAARERVMAGEKLPEPAAAELAHDTTAKPKPAIPETREERIARLQALLGEEFNPAVTDPTFDPHEAHKPRVPSVDELREAAA